MIRDHVLCTITVEFRRAIVDYSSGDSEFKGYEDKPHPLVWVGVFPSEAMAHAWASRRLKTYKSGRITNITSIRPDVVIIEHQW